MENGVVAMDCAREAFFSADSGERIQQFLRRYYILLWPTAALNHWLLSTQSGLSKCLSPSI
jgi:hypothetical protein